MFIDVYVYFVIPDFSNFMYLDKVSIGSCMYPKSFCDFDCTYNGFSYNLLDLAKTQDSKG